MQRELVQDPRFVAAFGGVTIYGVAGTNGSGKDTLMELLTEQGYLWFNTSGSLRQISQAVFKSTQRGGNESPMGRVGNAQRSTYPGGMVDLGLLDWWTRAAHLPIELRPKGLVIGSIRTVSEVESLKTFGGTLLLVDADPKVRYARLQARGRSDEEDITFEEFLAQEAGDMGESETDPAKFSMAAVIKMADITLRNDTDNIEAFKAQAAAMLL